MEKKTVRKKNFIFCFFYKFGFSTTIILSGYFSRETVFTNNLWVCMVSSSPYDSYTLSTICACVLKCFLKLTYNYIYISKFKSSMSFIIIPS